MPKKRKNKDQRRKYVLLAILVLLAGAAAWRIWQTPRPGMLHRQDAWLSSAEPERVDALPDNAFTVVLPEKIDGHLSYIRDYSASGHYQIVWEDVSAEAAEAYLNALLDKGFTRLMGTAEDIASGVLLARGDLTLSISLSGGTLNMLMTRVEEPTPTPLQKIFTDSRKTIDKCRSGRGKMKLAKKC